MQPDPQTLIETTLEASNNGQMHFGQVIGALANAGVESYHVDYRAARTTYYFPSNQTLTLALSLPEIDIACTFDATAIQAAIRGAQRGKVMYPEFKRLSQLAGCVAYTVWITGRHVSYFGRNGETHIERFPD
jgi:uncharacterized protein YbcV (DUF1398 family)